VDETTGGKTVLAAFNEGTQIEGDGIEEISSKTNREGPYLGPWDYAIRGAHRICLRERKNKNPLTHDRN